MQVWNIQVQKDTTEQSSLSYHLLVCWTHAVSLYSPSLVCIFSIKKKNRKRKTFKRNNANTHFLIRKRVTLCHCNTFKVCFQIDYKWLISQYLCHKAAARISAVLLSPLLFLSAVVMHDPLWAQQGTHHAKAQAELQYQTTGADCCHEIFSTLNTLHLHSAPLTALAK